MTYFEQRALPLLLQAAGYEALHASAIQTAAGVVAFAASPAPGRRPWRMAWHGEDTLYGPTTSSCSRRGRRDVVTTVSAPHPVNLRTESAGFFGDEGAISAASSADDRLAAVVVLDRYPQAEGRVSRLPARLGALTTILPHAFCFFAEEGRERRTVAAYLDLVARVPVFKFHPPVGFRGFDAALDQLETRLRDALGRL